MDIKTLRAQAVVKLGELGKIKKPTYSARDLHGKRQMLARVQRQERRRYTERVVKQKQKLIKDISDIDRYLQSVEDSQSYTTSIPANGNSKIPLIQSITPVVLPAPVIVFGKKPVLKMTRLSRHQRRGR